MKEHIEIQLLFRRLLCGLQSVFRAGPITLTAMLKVNDNGTMLDESSAAILHLDFSKA